MTEPADRQPATLTEALDQLRAQGYTVDFYATEAGQLECLRCGTTMDPADVQVDVTIRFEGDTNPDDEDIVFGLVCDAGCKGTYSAAYGPSAPPADAAVVRHLARH